jgi:hypothetical protein
VEDTKSVSARIGWLLDNLDNSNNNFSDVIILTNDNVKINSHKAILAASSPFFKNLFGGGSSFIRVPPSLSLFCLHSFASILHIKHSATCSLTV